MATTQTQSTTKATINFAQNLETLAAIKFANIYQTNQKLYCQLIACAQYCDELGIQVHQFHVSELAKHCQIKTISPTNPNLIYPSPSETTWRLFLGDELVSQWVQKRFDEMLDNTIKRLQIRLADQEHGSENDHRLLKLLLQLQKDNLKNKQQQVILAYWAPLSGAAPNQNQFSEQHSPADDLINYANQHSHKPHNQHFNQHTQDDPDLDELIEYETDFKKVHDQLGSSRNG